MVVDQRIHHGEVDQVAGFAVRGGGEYRQFGNVPCCTREVSRSALPSEDALRKSAGMCGLHRRQMLSEQVKIRCQKRDDEFDKTYIDAWNRPDR